MSEGNFIYFWYILFYGKNKTTQSIRYSLNIKSFHVNLLTGTCAIHYTWNKHEINLNTQITSIMIITEYGNSASSRKATVCTAHSKAKGYFLFSRNVAAKRLTLKPRMVVSVTKNKITFCYLTTWYYIKSYLTLK